MKRAVKAPTCMMKTVGTGKYNYRSLGIRKIRRLNMSRGGREGNNALVKVQLHSSRRNNNFKGNSILWNNARTTFFVQRPMK